MREAIPQTPRSVQKQCPAVLQELEHGQPMVRELCPYCIPWEGLYTGVGSVKSRPTEEEGVAETKDELTTAPIPVLL